MLQAAFSQFGAVNKAVIACDAPNNTSKGWGFVSFENKRFAVKAIEGTRERPFLVAAGLKPVICDWARNEEVMEGFSEEVRTGIRGAVPANLEGAGKFPGPSAKEHVTASRLMELRGEYEQLRALLKQRLREAEQQIIVTGNAPRLSHMVVNDPSLAQFMPGPQPPPGMGPPRAPAPGAYAHPPSFAPPPAAYGAPPPGGPGGMAPPPGGPGGYPGAPPPAAPYTAYPPPGQGEGPKRPGESFHHVPPPPKRQMHANIERFNPNPNAVPAKPPGPHPEGPGPQGGLPPPQPPPPQQPPPPAQRPSSAFVRGGELHTVVERQELAAAAGVPHAEGSTAPPAVGAKQPGSHDHGGIGFSGPASPPPGQTTKAGIGAVPPPVPADGSGGPTRAPYTAYAYGAVEQQQYGVQAPAGPQQAMQGQGQYPGYAQPPGPQQHQQAPGPQQPAPYGQQQPPVQQQQPYGAQDQYQQYQQQYYQYYQQQGGGAPPMSQGGQQQGYPGVGPAPQQGPGGPQGMPPSGPYGGPQQGPYGMPHQGPMPGQGYYG
ncbi:hypothetical protein HYH03_006084 [Edaphochlamys debaryana]|uniref:RRM domain-containing protein n=1 Tax=Edaphochlamys debaryana TaxID=47281 RepID=A0A835YBI0_9CHLO|nr:hypothetical protein HYH03_006084 [Edaphochlamys debaryana]|eukprot:KAG2495845.1 hypothetical protein HYH03_006084 [Edaphochlamys debaryana]